MSKKHFIQFAKAARAIKQECGLSEDQFEMLIDELALACSACSNSFDYSKFVDACNER